MGRFVIGGPSDRRVADVHPRRYDAPTPRTAVRRGSRSTPRRRQTANRRGRVQRRRSVMSRDDAGKYQRRLAARGLLNKTARGVYEWPYVPKNP